MKSRILPVVGVSPFATTAEVTHKDPETIPWERAVGHLYKGEVAEISQLENGGVVFRLKDGHIVSTDQPNLGAIVYEIENCGPPCVDVILPSELLEGEGVDSCQ